MPDIEMAARFAGVDTDYDRVLMEMCLRAAVDWYRKAGVPPRENDDMYDFWVCNLAAWMHTIRGAGGDEANIPPYIVHSLHQLRPRRAEVRSQ